MVNVVPVEEVQFEQPPPLVRYLRLCGDVGGKLLQVEGWRQLMIFWCCSRAGSVALGFRRV